MLSRLSVIPRYQFLDIAVEALSVSDLDALVQQGIASKTRMLIGNHNLHSLYLFHRSAAMRTFYQLADHIHVDGISIVWLARLLGHPLRRAHRTAYLDWLPSLMAGAQQRDWRVFYLGSRPGVLETGLARLRKEWPGLQIEGRHGYFDKASESVDTAEVLSQIVRYQPDLLFVGMGMPIQEEWIAENICRLPSCTIVACGALLDYVAGAIPTPPRWLGHLGLEWAFRLATDPRRLARRYLLEPWTLPWMVHRHRQAQSHQGFPPKA